MKLATKNVHTGIRAIVLGAIVAAVMLLVSDGEATVPLALASPRIANGTEIPSVYTCEGKGISPPLAWSAGPSSTRSFVLIVDDPDSPDPKAPMHAWVQWLVYNLPATTRSLDEGVQALPPGASQGTNDRHQARYEGPCPAVGQHRYFFRLFALDTVLSPALASPTRDELERAMKGHVLERSELMGLYEMHVDGRHVHR